MRTADDALIRVKLMIFYELKDIELMVSCFHIVYSSSPAICPTICLSTCPWESAFLLLKQKVSEYDRTYIHTCIHACMHAAYIHTYIRTYVHTYIHTYICVRVHACMRTHTHPHTPPTHTNIYTHLGDSKLHLNIMVHLCSQI